jgi:hypothetical protein
MAMGVKRRFWTVLQATPAFTLVSMSVQTEGLVQLLHGLNEVEIGIADLDEDAKTCGITQELIKNNIALALKENTPIKVIDENSRGGYAADIYVRQLIYQR